MSGERTSGGVIGVIADDFTGAAEIGGVAVRYGLTAEIWSPATAAWSTATETSFFPERPTSDVDVICLDTNSRACPPDVATKRVAQGATAVHSTFFPGGCTFPRAMLFKKTDSVLRGQVAAELTGLMDATGRKRVLLVPANPSLGRTVQDGRYLIQGTPLDQTHFAHDPEYPARTADVAMLIAGPQMQAEGSTVPVYVLNPARASEMSTVSSGIIVGEASTHEDVVAWAASLDATTIPAGAAEFFGAFLETREGGQGGHTTKYGTLNATEGEEHPNTRDTALFVVGSTSDASRTFCLRCEAHHIPVIRIPMQLFEEKGNTAGWIGRWEADVLQAFEHSPREGGQGSSVVVAIDRPLCRVPGLPQRLSGYLATVTQRVLSQQPVSVVFVEGGATAVALVRQFGWDRMRVKQELAPGSVSLQSMDGTGPLLAMKPGSYVWPEEVWPWT